MKSQVYKILAERKRQAERRAEQSYSAACLDSRFKASEREYKQLMIARAKNPRAVTAAQVNKARAARADELKRLGLTEQDLEPRYSCAKCNDTGYVNSGECTCAKKLLSSMLLEASGICALPQASFKDFKPELYREGRQRDKIIKLYSDMQEFCRKFPNVKHRSVMLTGDTGVGKTQLIVSVARELATRGFNVIYTTAFALGRLMLKSHTDFSGGGDPLDAALNCDLLVIDDLGSEPKYRNVTEEYMLTLLNERMLSGKSTFVSTNCSLDELEKFYGTRVTSRLSDRNVWRRFLLTGSDIRLLSREDRQD